MWEKQWKVIFYDINIYEIWIYFCVLKIYIPTEFMLVPFPGFIHACQIGL